MFFSNTNKFISSKRNKFVQNKKCDHSILCDPGMNKIYMGIIMEAKNIELTKYCYISILEEWGWVVVRVCVYLCVQTPARPLPIWGWGEL